MRAPFCRLLTGLLLLPFLTGSALAGDARMPGTLARQAQLGFQAPIDGGLVIRRVDEGTPAARAGIVVGDRITAVGGQRFDNGFDGAALLQRAKGGNALRLSLTRDGQERDISFTPDPWPLENYPELDIEYGSFTSSDGTILRTLVSRPVGATGPLPALFITQWVSCGTIETIRSGRDLIAGLMRRAGWATIRVERSGSGDSSGIPCHRLDYDTELRHYREALDSLSRHPWVDADKLVIAGFSLGATTAPLLAQGRPVAGLLVQGGGAVTYLERMINFDRMQMELADTPPAEIDARMRRNIRFQVEYLLKGKQPDRIVREQPDLAGVWESLRGAGPGTSLHYGRPTTWHQQAATKDFAGAWAQIAAPVLVFYGEYDQFEPAYGHALIVDIVNRRQPGLARLATIPMADHDLEIAPSRVAANKGEGTSPAPELFLTPSLAWLKAIAAGTAP